MASSMEHEGAVALFEHRPTLALDLLAALGRRIPAYVDVRVESSNLTQLDPAAFFADAVLVARDASDAPVLATVVEFQRQVDPGKRSVWSVYVATVGHRFECPVHLLVVTPSRNVASWARQPIEVVPGAPWRPSVVGPDEIPTVTEVEDAVRAPELAVLSAFARARGDDVVLAARVAYAAKKACEALGGEKGLLYWSLVDVALDEAQAEALEALMAAVGEKELGYFARKYLALGREEGREEGREAGREEGQRTLVRQLLIRRFGEVPPWVEARLAAADGGRLEELAGRLLNAPSLEALFEA